MIALDFRKKIKEVHWSWTSPTIGISRVVPRLGLSGKVAPGVKRAAPTEPAERTLLLKAEVESTYREGPWRMKIKLLRKRMRLVTMIVTSLKVEPVPLAGWGHCLQLQLWGRRQSDKMYA